MSTVSLIAGNTSWTDSITCDLCNEKVERKGTGEMRRGALPIDDPRVIEQNRSISTLRTSATDLPEIEYEVRAFAPGALKDWGSFGARGARMDLCPSCCQVVCDLLLEHTKPGTNAPFGTMEERKYGTEVPALSFERITTNLRAAGELGEAIGDASGARLLDLRVEKSKERE